MSSEEKTFYDIENVDEYKDFICELSHIPHIIAQILQYLNVRELCLMSCVSKSWRNTLISQSVANQRRIRHLKKIKKLRKSVGQENWPIKKRTPVATNTRRDALSDIRNVYRTRKPKRSTTQLAHTLTPNTRHNSNRDMGLRALR